jgi:hypothetical protein
MPTKRKRPGPPALSPNFVQSLARGLSDSLSRGTG